MIRNILGLQTLENQTKYFVIFCMFIALFLALGLSFWTCIGISAVIVFCIFFGFAFRKCLKNAKNMTPNLGNAKKKARKNTKKHAQMSNK